VTRPALFRRRLAFGRFLFGEVRDFPELRHPEPRVFARNRSYFFSNGTEFHPRRLHDDLPGTLIYFIERQRDAAFGCQILQRAGVWRLG
jgi:hypothetical protein